MGRTTRRLIPRARPARPIPGGDPDGPAAGPGGGWGRSELDDLKAAGYEVRRLLGRGGMGVVTRRARSHSTAGRAQSWSGRGAFASESELLRFPERGRGGQAELDHPHIVPIYEVGSHHGRHFFSMKRSKCCRIGGGDSAYCIFRAMVIGSGHRHITVAGRPALARPTYCRSTGRLRGTSRSAWRPRIRPARCSFPCRDAR